MNTIDLQYVESEGCYTIPVSRTSKVLGSIARIIGGVALGIVAMWVIYCCLICGEGSTAFIFACWVGCSIGCGMLASKQGRSSAAGALLGFFFGFFALVGYAIAGDTIATKARKVAEYERALAAARQCR